MPIEETVSNSATSDIPHASGFKGLVAQRVAALKSGDFGALPVVVGLLVLSIIFQSLNGNFLTPGNMVNLLVQGSIYMLLAMGIIFVLLIAEIDISVGFVGGVAGVVVSILAYGDTGSPWFVSIGAGLLTGFMIGILHGLIITIVRLPAFVVTLAGFLSWNGVMLMILGDGGVVPIHDKVIISLANGLMSPALGWVLAAAIIAVYGYDRIAAFRRRKHSGNDPGSVLALYLNIAVVAGATIFLVALCNVDRGRFAPVQGVPWVVLIVLAFAVMWTFVLNRTAFGTYIYAIGGNAEAARRAGIPVDRIRLIIFAIAGTMGAVAGIIYASRLRSVSTNLDGGILVLYSIAAAVIGGTSLFGGRGKPTDAVLGGLVIAALDNGMGLLGLSAAARYVMTGIVLVIAVSVDAFAGRIRARAGAS